MSIHALELFVLIVALDAILYPLPVVAQSWLANAIDAKIRDALK